MSKVFKMLINDWQAHYRFNGGPVALWRCWQGTRRIMAGHALDPQAGRQDSDAPAVDCLVFSVVPKMSALWALLIGQAIPARPLRVLVGDCSGALHRYLPPLEHVHALPLLNYHHGEKLDIFMDRLCQAEYVVVTDDDIFWMDSQPWEWALKRLQTDPKIAVVSLLPKKGLSSVLQGKVPLPMGSCFVVRRSTWAKEKLSFRVVYPPKTENVDWIYDTGEFAQVTLLQRGYQIEIAPPELQTHLVAFEGISSWTLKIQKNAGRILANIKVDPRVRPEKALRTICMARSLSQLVRQYLPGVPNPHLIRPSFLDQAERDCRQFVSAARAAELAAEIQIQVARLQERLAAKAPIQA